MSMSFEFVDLISSGGLFLGMLLCFEVGRRIGVARLARDPDGLATGSGPVEAAVFGLLGLLLAFTFSGAASRFDERRHLIGKEANVIGTAYLRIDLLPVDAQPEIRQLFRRYLDTRVEAYRNATDKAATEARLSEGAALQRDIWSKAVSASARPEARTQAAMLLLPALNDMIDITTTRAVAMQNHPPLVIFLLLAGLSLASSMLAGYVMSSTKGRSWFYMLLIAITISLTLYVILDLEYPRFGLIRIDSADQILLELRGQMR
jgi:hypothetical protein